MAMGAGNARHAKIILPMKTIKNLSGHLLVVMTLTMEYKMPNPAFERDRAEARPLSSTLAQFMKWRCTKYLKFCCKYN